MPNDIEHERMRFKTMTEEQLASRLRKITDKQKLLNYIHCCDHFGYSLLKRSAQTRYELLFPSNKNSNFGGGIKVAIVEKVNPKYMDSTEPISSPSTDHKVAKIKTCPVCNKPFTLQAGVDGDCCSEKCWRILAYNQWEKKEFGNKKGYVDYSSPPKNSNGYDYLDTTDELIRKIAGVKPKPIKKPEPTKPVDFIDVLPKRKLRLD